jgi:5-methylcytosine-specific restriction enzyme subunit McrC
MTGLNDLTKIPVLNLYYLLSYAWDKLEEAQQTDVSQSDHQDSLSLFARILCSGTERLLKRGLDRDYIEHNELVNRIRGSVDFAASISTTFMKMPRLVCDFDEFERDILHNRILKTTIRNLLFCEGLDRAYHNELRLLHGRLSGITEIPLTKRSFSSVRLNRNNWYYDFLMKVCELIFECLTPSENAGRYKYQDFVRNHRQMAQLFEAFVLNFYKKEQNTYVVKRETIEWDITEAAAPESLAVLPRMNTDISLESEKHKIIIDTKFYHDTLSQNYGKELAKSSNLYQIFAYLMNDTHPNNEGILLYPETSAAADYRWQIKGRNISVRTINLNQPWPLIHAELLGIIGM